MKQSICTATQQQGAAFAILVSVKTDDRRFRQWVCKKVSRNCGLFPCLLQCQTECRRPSLNGTEESHLTDKIKSHDWSLCYGIFDLAKKHDFFPRISTRFPSSFFVPPPFFSLSRCLSLFPPCNQSLQMMQWPTSRSIDKRQSEEWSVKGGTCMQRTKLIRLATEDDPPSHKMKIRLDLLGAATRCTKLYGIAGCRSLTISAY